MHCARSRNKNIPPIPSPSLFCIPTRNHREKLCSSHRIETFTSPIVIQTGVRIFYGTYCYEWRTSGVLLFVFRFPFFFLFFPFNRSDATLKHYTNNTTSLRGDREKIGVNISVLKLVYLLFDIFGRIFQGLSQA